ncbi:MAG: thioesterase family protein [Deltaproteobacteria bacterium]|nr:thioesterase family protein [Deltaproteobacteria bacterium]
MARVEIDMPDEFPFETELEVFSAFINAAGHMGNDSLVTLLNEARTRFMRASGAGKLLPTGTYLINADSALIYRSEAFYGDRLRFQVTATDFHKVGCDIVSRVTHAESGKEVALAKAGMIYFDNETHKVLHLPAEFREKISSF